MKKLKAEFVTYPTESMGYAPGGIAIEPAENADLPLDATPIMCCKRDPKLMAIRFAGEQISRAHQILAEYHLNPQDCLVFTKTRMSLEECDMILPVDVVSKLSQDEKDRAREFVPPVQIISHPPVLYRFIEKEYVEDFFEKGSLLVSSFSRCRRIEGVGCRADWGEGKCSVVGMTKSNTIEAVIGASGNPLVLCLSLSPEANHEPADEWFEIQDFNMFLKNVTDAIIAAGIKVRRVLFGPCTYSERHIVRKFVDGNAMIDKCGASIDLEAKKFDGDKVFGAVFQVVKDDHYFRKPLQFSGEQEFRIVWDCDVSDGFDHCIVTVKDPDCYCCRRYTSS